MTYLTFGLSLLSALFVANLVLDYCEASCK